MFNFRRGDEDDDDVECVKGVAKKKSIDDQRNEKEMNGGRRGRYVLKLMINQQRRALELDGKMCAPLSCMHHVRDWSEHKFPQNHLSRSSSKNSRVFVPSLRLHLSMLFQQQQVHGG